MEHTLHSDKHAKIAEHIGVSDNQPPFGVLESLFSSLFCAMAGLLAERFCDDRGVPDLHYTQSDEEIDRLFKELDKSRKHHGAERNGL